MSEFVYFFRSTVEQQTEAMGTPTRAQRSMETWFAWVKELEARGHLKDPGQPLDRNGKVVSGGQKLVTDGPFAEAKDIVLGFMMIEAADLAEATELAKGCPITFGGGSVEVRPVMKLQG
jgi:hypothetical protein